MKGIGIDIIELQDIDADKLYKVFTESEKNYVDRSTNIERRREVVAGIYAGKEAVFKAMGLRNLGLQVLKDIEIKHRDSGQPYVVYKGIEQTILLSISHTHSTAVAVAIY